MNTQLYSISTEAKINRHCEHKNNFWCNVTFKFYTDLSNVLFHRESSCSGARKILSKKPGQNKVDSNSSTDEESWADYDVLATPLPVTTSKASSVNSDSEVIYYNTNILWSWWYNSSANASYHSDILCRIKHIWHLDWSGYITQNLGGGFL